MEQDKSIDKIEDALSFSTIQTVLEMRENYVPKKPVTEIFFKDSRDSSCNSRGKKKQIYKWLPPGWIVEERIMHSRRVYRYYYDPSGFMYTKRHIAEAAIADMETRNVADEPPSTSAASSSAPTSSAVNKPSQVSDGKGKAPMV